SSIVAPIESAVQGLAGALVSAIGARAIGGPVMQGGAYIVGERGPELFVPSGSGNIVPAASAPMRPQIVVNVQTPNAQSFLKSESQVAAMMTRALLRGQARYRNEKSVRCTNSIPPRRRGGLCCPWIFPSFFPPASRFRRPVLRSRCTR